jgi:hypothetical protein
MQTTRLPTRRFKTGHSQLMENQTPTGHIGWMAQRPRTKLLEVTVCDLEDGSWEWRLIAGDEVLIIGFADTHSAARTAGQHAMFLMLASGWNA